MSLEINKTDGPGRYNIHENGFGFGDHVSTQQMSLEINKTNGPGRYNVHENGLLFLCSRDFFYVQETQLIERPAESGKGAERGARRAVQRSMKRGPRRR